MRMRTTTNQVARVARLARGPVLSPNLVNLDDDNEGDGPPYPEPSPGFSISMSKPSSGQHAGLASTGVTLVASGTFKVVEYELVSLSVRFPGGAFRAATRFGNTWKATGAPITAPVSGKVEARLTVRNGESVLETATAERNVQVVITDDIPKVTVTAPITVESTSGIYTVPLTAAVESPTGVTQVRYRVGSGGWVVMSAMDAPGVWSANARLNYDDEPQTITVAAKGGTDVWGEGDTNVRTTDTRAPKVRIRGDDVVSVPGQGPSNSGTLRLLRGTAKDHQSEVKNVEWRVRNDGQPNGGTFLGVTDRSGSSWSVKDIALSAGVHQIEVRATDHAGNATREAEWARLEVAVTEEYRPKDPTVHEYLTALVDFVAKRFQYAAGAVDADLLAQVFRQPVARLLSAPPEAPGPRVAQLRICLEVLFTHLDDLLTASGDPAAVIPVGEGTTLRAVMQQNHRRRSYEAMLRRIGTSVEELTAALDGGDAEQLSRLADRLGIELAPRKSAGPAPGNTLEPLRLAGDGVTDEALEQVFGIPSFNRDPLATPGGDPYLLGLQLLRLRSSFRLQDDAVTEPLVDPDVITLEDLQPGTNPAERLLRARQTWLEELLTDLREDRGRAPGPRPTPAGLVARFDEILARYVAPVRDLDTLHDTHESGESITAGLEAVHLTFAGFDRLLKLRALAVTETITDVGWEDLYAIVAGVQKRRARVEWRQDERGLGIHVGPAYFQAAGAPRPGDPISPWRVDVQARRRWLTALEGRVEQLAAARQAYESATAGVEEDTLPQLRDAMLELLATLAPATASSLGDRFLIDVMADGSTRLTRVEQAIQTLQALVLGVRLGTVPGWVRVTPGEAEFDEELRWIGSYSTWYSAMQVFLYPENHLSPLLRPNDDGTGDRWSTEFGQLVARLRGARPLTPDAADTIAAAWPTVTGQADLRAPRTPNAYTAWRVASWLAVGPLAPNPPAQPRVYVERLAAIPRSVKERYYYAPLTIALALHRSGQYLAALDWFRMVYAYDLPATDERKTYYGLVLEANRYPAGQPLLYERNLFWLARALNPHDIVDESYQVQAPETARWEVHTRFVVSSIVRCLLDFADAEFLQDTNESLPRARSLYQEALDLLDLPELNPAKVPELTPNEVTDMLRQRAETSLAKLRTGRNYAGLTRQLEPATPSGTAGTALAPLVTGSGPFGSGGLRGAQPTPYRFSTLVERAKQLAGVAQQVEQSYLAAIEKLDAERYTLFKAKQDMALANAQVALQGLRAAEATSGVLLASKQQDRATFQVDEYQKLLDAPMNRWESALLNDYAVQKQVRQLFDGAEAALAVAQAVNQAASGGFLGTGVGAGNIISAGFTLLSYSRYIQKLELNAIETDIQRHSLHASVENRVREWTLQQGVARKDEGIAAQQYQVALDQQAIVTQEGVIAGLQFAQAEATIAFLVNKFTNVELYEWMVGVLQEVYGYFLRQATSVAQLAQSQLAFQTQDPVPALIRRDYWQPSDDTSLTGSADPKDRAGLTGSARLLQDVYQLDQLAFDSNARKLQLAKTFSLAQLAPVEFQQFRRTGVLMFATPMRIFDEEFPGHYLRLLKRVRTSVVALVPPQRGIRATLSNPGVSRVVVGGDGFQSVRLTREPESVALTSPSGASGVFDLDAQPELLLPFELSGVDTVWTLELPKAANPFDYRTIADVLVTFEYTALASTQYRAKVTQQLDRKSAAVRTYSLRDQFPDQWYDLHHPSSPDAPVEVEYTVRGADFPVNVDEVTTSQLALYLVPATDDDDTSGEPRVPVRVVLSFTSAGAAEPVEGEATSTTDGILSTRIGNAASWLPMLNRSPAGAWRAAFPDRATMRELLDREALADVVLAVSYTARLPEWPR
jgi:hypothetical protein